MRSVCFLSLLLFTLACGVKPPVEKGDFLPTDLVELTSVDPSLKLDIRYATSNNFIGRPVYSEARAFLQRDAAMTLKDAHTALKAQGLGLLIFDGYRPWSITKLFWDRTPKDKKIFVADPKKGSRHNRGCAIDLSLYDLNTGVEIEMTGAYDEMSDRSYPDYKGGTEKQRQMRDILRKAMESVGYTVYEYEWWHFDYKDWRQYRIGNQAFNEIN